MTQLINLLPWRALQRRRRLRCRIGITVLMILLLVSGFWIAWTSVHQQVITLENQADELEMQRQRLQETVQYQQALLQRGEQQQQEQLTETGRQDRVSRWEGILEALARTLPESSWLRTVSWQSGVLTFEGYTADIGDLEKIEMQLTKLPGRFQVRAGPVSYHAVQGLSYTFILTEKGGKFVLP